MRRCPRCRTLLRPLFNGRVELDHCPACQGNFFDPGEAKTSFGAVVDPAHWRATHAAEEKGVSPLACPAGHGPLTAYDLSWEGAHVEVDACATCQGLWLDAAEGGRLYALVGRYEQARHKAEHLPGVKSYLFQLVTGFPIEVFHPVRRRPVVVYALLFGLTAAFLAQAALFLRYGEGASERLLPFMLVPARILEGQALAGLVSHAFLHGGVAHLVGNLYFLWVFGDNVEDRLGRGRFALLYAAAALGGAALHFAVEPHSEVPMLGASGAISGVMAAYLWLYPRMKMWVVLFFVRFKISVFWYLCAWVLGQVALAALAVPGVAWYAHLGGFAAGLLVVVPLTRGSRR